MTFRHRFSRPKKKVVQHNGSASGTTVRQCKIKSLVNCSLFKSLALTVKKLAKSLLTWQHLSSLLLRPPFPPQQFLTIKSLLHRILSVTLHAKTTTEDLHHYGPYLRQALQCMCFTQPSAKTNSGMYEIFLITFYLLTYILLGYTHRYLFPWASCASHSCIGACALLVRRKFLGGTLEEISRFR